MSRRIRPLHKIQNLGRGLDTVLDEYKADIFEPGRAGEITFPSYDERDLFQFHIVTSQSEFARTTSVSAKAKGSYGIGKAKASGSVRSFFTSNSYSCYLIGYFRKSARPYDIDNPRLKPEILRFITRNRQNPHKIERKLGNKVITGVNLAAELVVIAEFQTSSEQRKRDIAASLSAKYGSASGSAKYAEAISSVKTASKKTISVGGHIPDSKIDLTSEAELITLLNDFNVNYQSKLRSTSYITRDYSSLNQLLEIDFVNDADVRLREAFAWSLNSLYQDYSDWWSDISYVLDEDKRAEFEQSVIDRARSDKETCKKGLKSLLELEEKALEAWEEENDWQRFYSQNLLSGFLQEFPRYKQRESTTQPPKPKPRSPPARIDKGGGFGCGRC